MSARTPLLLLALSCGTAPLAGQTIRGQVVDSAAGQPVGVGFVVLLDSAGAEVTRVLTSSQGRFLIQLAGPGRYRLRSDRIGYRQAYSSFLEVAAAETLEYELRVAQIPVRLTTIEVEAETRCRERPDEEESTALLWEEAQKALAAASWSANQRTLQHRLHQYTRDLGRRRRRVSDEQARVSAGNYRSPYRSIDPVRLSSEGYLITERDGVWYYAPDAEVLRHDSFIATHCFRARQGDDRYEGMIGLAFEPEPGRRMPDVRGVLWLDRESSELRAVEYQYTNLPNAPQDDRIGGTVEFLPLPNGAWIVHKWQIRMPRVVEYASRDGIGTGRRELTGFRDTGGQIIEMYDLDGHLLYRSPDIVTVRGTVFDSTRGRPLSNASVQIANTPYNAVTGREGQFEVTTLLDGEYDLTFAHLRADSLGYRPSGATIDVGPGDTVGVALAIPGLDAVLDRVCRRHRGDPEHARVLVGRVLGPQGRPARDAPVRASWQRISVPTDPSGQWAVRDSEQSVKTDDRGWYAVCDLPPDRGIALEATDGDENLGLARVVFETGRVLTAPDHADTPYREFYLDGPIWRQDLVLFPAECYERQATVTGVERRLVCDAQGAGPASR